MSLVSPEQAEDLQKFHIVVEFIKTYPVHGFSLKNDVVEFQPKEDLSETHKNELQSKIEEVFGSRFTVSFSQTS